MDSNAVHHIIYDFQVWFILTHKLTINNCLDDLKNALVLKEVTVLKALTY